MTELELAAMLTDAENHALRALAIVHAPREASPHFATELGQTEASFAIGIRKMSPAVERGKREAERAAEKESAA